MTRRAARTPLVALAAALGAGLLAAPHPAAAQFLDGRPLRVEPPWTLAFGEHALEVGADIQSGVRPAPLLGSGQAGDLLRVPVLRYRAGFGRVEVSVAGAGQLFFNPDDKNVSDEDEPGDAALFAKVLALREGPRRPAVGVAFGVKLPNASDESGLGTDETDAYLGFLLGKSWGWNELRFNVGLGILGNPLDGADQEDVLTWGVGGRHGARHAFTWEVWGSTLSEDERNVDEARARLGYAVIAPRWAFDVSLFHGLDEESGDLGASAGATWILGEERTR